MARTRSLLTLLGILSMIVSGFIFLTSSRTHAGFEWVPAKKEIAAPVATPAPTPSAAITIEPPMQKVSAPSLPPVQIEEPQTIDLPAIQTTPDAEIQPHETQSTIKIIRPQDRAAPEVVMPAPVASTPAPKTKIIMPEDAPDSALENSENAVTMPTRVTTIDAAPVIKEAAIAEEKPQETFAEIAGFGSDMPLAFALSQIVPDTHAYSLGKNVNPAALVSWNGGRSWPVVIQDMVKPLDLSIALKGETILIYNPVEMPDVEQHSAIEIQADTDASTAPVQLTVNETQRLNITTPSENMSAQPEETMEKIEKIAQTQKFQEVDTTIETIEPASGAKEINSYKAKQFWQAKSGESVKAVLDDWSETANVKMVWDAPHDFTLSNNILVNDDFENALVMMLSHAINAQDAPSMTLLETPGETTSAKVIIK